MIYFRKLFPAIACIALAACAHEEPMPNVAAAQPHYVLQSQQGAEAVTMPGHISRYQRQAIVAGGGGAEPKSKYAKNFDEVLDHLETLMAPQIAENNRIAAQQAANPSFTF